VSKAKVKLAVLFFILCVLSFACAFLYMGCNANIAYASELNTINPTWTGYSDGHVESYFTMNASTVNADSEVGTISLYDYGYGVAVTGSITFSSVDINWNTGDDGQEKGGYFRIVGYFTDDSGNDIANTDIAAYATINDNLSYSFTLTPSGSAYRADRITFYARSNGFSDCALTVTMMESYTAVTVTYAPGDGTGTVVEVNNYKLGETITLPAFSKYSFSAPAYHEFHGWSDGTSTYLAGDNYRIMSDGLTFTALYSGKYYTVSYCTGLSASEYSSNSYRYDTTIQLSDCPSDWIPSGKYFKGWTVGTSVYYAGTDYTVTCDVTFTAWFDYLIANSTSYIGFSDGTCYCTFTAAMGSASGENCLSKIPLHSYGNGTGAKITITLNSVDVSYSSTSLGAAAYVKVYTQSGYLKESASFSLSAGGSISITISSIVNSGEYLSYLELYTVASFTSISLSGRVDESPIYTTVTYKSGDGVGGDVVADNICVGETYSLASFSRLAISAARGYHFAKWSDGTNTYEEGTKIRVMEALTFTAQYEIDIYTVTYKSAYSTGDIEISGGEHSYGTEVVLSDCPSIFVRDGYTFAGWTVDDGVTLYKAGATWTLVDDTVFEAVYDLVSNESSSTETTKKYLVTYLVGDGTGETLYVNVAENCTFMLESFPSTWSAPEGQIFDGWKLGKTVYSIGTSFSATKDMTFTATYKNNGKSSSSATNSGDSGTTSSSNDSSSKIVQIVVGVAVIAVVVFAGYKIYTIVRRKK